MKDVATQIAGKLCWPENLDNLRRWIIMCIKAELQGNSNNILRRLSLVFCGPSRQSLLLPLQRASCLCNSRKRHVAWSCRREHADQLVHEQRTWPMQEAHSYSIDIRVRYNKRNKIIIIIIKITIFSNTINCSPYRMYRKKRNKVCDLPSAAIKKAIINNTTTTKINKTKNNLRRLINPFHTRCHFLRTTYRFIFFPDERVTPWVNGAMPKLWQITPDWTVTRTLGGGDSDDACRNTSKWVALSLGFGDPSTRVWWRRVQKKFDCFPTTTKQVRFTMRGRGDCEDWRFWFRDC